MCVYMYTYLQKSCVCIHGIDLILFSNLSTTTTLYTSQVCVSKKAITNRSRANLLISQKYTHMVKIAVYNYLNIII